MVVADSVGVLVHKLVHRSIGFLFLSACFAATRLLPSRGRRPCFCPGWSWPVPPGSVCWMGATGIGRVVVAARCAGVTMAMLLSVYSGHAWPRGALAMLQPGCAGVLGWVSMLVGFARLSVLRAAVVGGRSLSSAGTLGNWSCSLTWLRCEELGVGGIADVWLGLSYLTRALVCRGKAARHLRTGMSRCCWMRWPGVVGLHIGVSARACTWRWWCKCRCALV